MDPLQLEIDGNSDDAVGAIETLTDSINGLNDNISGLNDNTDDATESTSGFGSALSSVGTIIAGIGITDLIGDVIDLGNAFVTTAIDSSEAIQNVGISVGYLYGTSGQQILDFTNKLADASGLLSKSAFQQLLPQLSNLHEPISQVETDLQAMGNIASGTGINAQDMAGKLQIMGNALGYAGQIGSVSSIMLRPLIRQIPDFAQALSSVTGLPVESFKSMSKNIVISLTDMQEAITKLGFGQYGGALAAQGQSLAGLSGRIQDSLTEVLDTILGVSTTGQVAKGSIFSQLEVGAQDFLNFISQNKGTIESFVQGLITDFGKNVGPAIEGAFSWIITHRSELESMIEKFATDSEKFATALATKAIPDFENFLKWLDQHKEIFTTIGNVLTGITNLVSGFGANGAGPVTSSSPMGEGSNYQGTLQWLLGMPQANVNNSKTTNITMHNNISNNVDMSAATRELAWRINGR